MSEQRKKRLEDATERLTLIVERHQAGARLPTERELCEQLGVGRSTVREAVSRLAALGSIRVVHGRGMFAAARPAAGANPGQLAVLLERAAESARALGLSERDLVDATAAAYRSQGAGQAELLLVAPLPSAARAEVMRLLDAHGVPYRAATAGEVPPGATAVAGWEVAKRLLEGGAEVTPVAASLSADLIVAFSALGRGEEIAAYAPDAETLAAVEETARSLRPDLRLSGSIGAPRDAGRARSALLVPAEAAGPEPRDRVFSYRAGLSDLERQTLLRRLSQPEPAATASRPSASSMIGSASSQTLD